MTDKYMHYCGGTWREGYVLDCEQVDDHKVKLVQTEEQREATAAYLAGTDAEYGGEG